MPSISGPRSTVASNFTVTPFVSGVPCSLLLVLSSLYFQGPTEPRLSGGRARERARGTGHPLQPLVRTSFSKFLKETIIDLECRLGPHAEFQFLEHLDEFVAIDKFNRKCPIAPSFSSRLLRECPRRQDDALVRSALHSPSEVPDIWCSDAPSVPLALEQDLERHKRIEFEDAVTIYTFVAGPSSHRHLLEPGFAKEALAEPLESGKRQLLDYLQKSIAILR